MMTEQEPSPELAAEVSSENRKSFVRQVNEATRGEYIPAALASACSTGARKASNWLEVGHA